MDFVIFYVLIFLTFGSVAAAPSYHGCDTLPGKAMKWCNHSLSHTSRIQELLNVLTVDEKIGLLSPNGRLGSSCNDHTQGAPRVGLSQYMWLVETNTGANSQCLSNGKCATTFPGPLGIGASFNRTSWYYKGNVIGTELRAFNNIGWNRDAGGTFREKIGLTGFGPNLNNPRDPRFGRLSELPSEDPFHAGHYCIGELSGAQEEDKNGHPKMVSFLKHFTAYSKETNRGHDSYDISKFDLFDSYLAQYKICFTQGTARGAMCSYDAENGRPSCANDYILNTVVRGMWKQPDAFISTDCGAVRNLRGPPANAPSDAAAAAWAINNGTDLEMGSDLVLKNLRAALDQNLTTEAVINEAARRTLVHLFAAGRFDRLEDVEWSKFNADDVASPLHTQIRDEAALQSFVLLKNEGGTLPIKPGAKVAVIGPQAEGKGLFSDYFGDDICPGRNKKNMDCVPTIADSIKAVNVGGVTTTSPGCDINSNDKSKMQAALDTAKAADIVVLALGIDKSIEHEGHDRMDIGLPGLQSELALSVLALKKPTVLVLTNGGPLAIDELVDGPDAIVEAFNPAFGAPMLAQTLFGLHNRWGKLPYTIYNKNYTSEVDFNNYDMAKAPGRTYRYFTGTPLFKYGTGMSYTTFSVSCSSASEENSPRTFPMKFSCVVKNTGQMAGDEVVLVYHQVGDAIRKAAAHPVPIKALCAFERVSVAPGKSSTVEFSLSEDAFMLTTQTGDSKLYPGKRTLLFSHGVGEAQAIPVDI